MTPLEGLLERDGGGCVWCGRELWRSDLTVEHLCPRSRNGSSLPENLLVACRDCNHTRRSRAAVSFATEREREGYEPRWPLLGSALRRLSRSRRRPHRDYGRAQLRHLRG